jgi:hypothetical protein
MRGVFALNSIKLQNQVKDKKFCLNAGSRMDLRDFKLPQRNKLNLPSSGILRSL